MAEHEPEPDVEGRPAGVNPGYAAFQIAKALTTSEEHDDPATRQHAKEKVARWATVLRNILNGTVEYGSRTPVEGVPGWATLEVVTGGFASGALLAAGPIQEHEQKLLKTLSSAREGEERLTLNVHFLTDGGLDELRERLRTGSYDVSVPEEGALMVVAWLVEHGYTDEARGLLDGLLPYFPKMRFYPIPLERPRQSGSRVHLQDVGSTIHNLQMIKPNNRLLAQKEAVEIWAPFYDRMVGLFLETVEKSWPCQHYPAGWSERAIAILDDYAELRKEHQLCRKPERSNGHFAQLLALLARCARKPNSLKGREVGRLRLILNRYVDKRGSPASEECVEARRRQLRDVSGPPFHEIVRVIVPRLEKHPKDEGLDDVSHIMRAVTHEDSAGTGIPVGTPIPPSIQRKVGRCLNETVGVLVDRGIITSAETLARVLPQMTSELRAAGISDPALRQLYASLYRAFRRRRSLLLLNLEKQIQIEELPWVAAIDRFRSKNLSSRELAKLTLEEVTLITITSFPHMIIPNKLLQELRALVKDADLNVPLVAEVAADIFMGEFSGSFLDSAKRAAHFLDGTLYATYYGIDYGEVVRIPKAPEGARRKWFWQTGSTRSDGFVQLCSSRAGVPLGSWEPATNGMIIEQQQILTTQNLAALFAGLDLTDTLRGQLGEMAKRCFVWICKRHQVKTDNWHARLIVVKNTAYAWRQMVFFLALLPTRAVSDFLGWAEDHLNAQREEFRNRFRPALKGLALAAAGGSLDSESARQEGIRRFLGWSKTRHWVLTETENP
jgi:hypothetical protein